MGGFDDLSGDEEKTEGGNGEIDSFKKLKQKTRKAKKELGKQKLNVGIYGKEKTGKSHFGLSAPDPILVIDTESGTNAIEHKFSDKDIRVANINVAGDDYTEDNVKSWEEFEEIVRMAVENEDKFETVVVDSTADIWKFVQNYCKVEIWDKEPEDRLDQQWDWGDINSRYTNLVQKLLDADFHVILTSRAKEIYNGAGNPSGEFQPKWQKQTGHWLNVVIFNEKKWVDGGNRKELNSTIEASRIDYEDDRTVMGHQTTFLEFPDLQNLLENVVKGEDL